MTSILFLLQIATIIMYEKKGRPCPVFLLTYCVDVVALDFLATGILKMTMASPSGIFETHPKSDLNAPSEFANVATSIL